MLSNQCAIILARTCGCFNANRPMAWPSQVMVGAWVALPWSMADKHRNFRVREYLGGHAAEHDRGNAAASVRGHDDEVATPLLGGRDDGFVRMVFFDLHRVAYDPSCA